MYITTIYGIGIATAVTNYPGVVTYSSFVHSTKQTSNSAESGESVSTILYYYTFTIYYIIY